MDELYISNNELENLLTRDQIPDKIAQKMSVGISSIADLIEIIEGSRKSRNDKTAQLCNSCKQHSSNGDIYLAELDGSLLLKNLFDDEIWDKFANTKSNPLMIARYISLKKADETIWWSDAIYEQMKSIYE